MTLMIVMFFLLLSEHRIEFRMFRLFDLERRYSRFIFRTHNIVLALAQVWCSIQFMDYFRIRMFETNSKPSALAAG